MFGWLLPEDSTEKRSKVRVTSQGQTVVSPRDLLASSQVKQFMNEFSPQVAKYIQTARSEREDQTQSDQQKNK